jgi:hypothetical protein
MHPLANRFIVFLIKEKKKEIEQCLLAIHAGLKNTFASEGHI